MVRYLAILLGLTLAFCNSVSLAAQFNASVDRQQLNIDEKVTLTLSLTNSDTRLRAEGVEPNIDLSPLHRDFDLGVPKTDFRYNIYQGQGRSNSVLRVELFPRHGGDITIPSFTLDGLSTQPISLTVKQEAGAAPEVFVRPGSSKQTLWQGEQLVVFLDIYHRVKLNKAKKTAILETEPTRIELLPHWELPQGRYQSEYQGFQYNVLRLAWALFPEETGAFYVYLPRIEVTTEGGDTRYFPHEKLDFDVQPLPGNLPQGIIIGRPDISYTLLPSHLTQNQLAHFTVTIKAPVAVSALPNYLPTPTSLSGVKLYPDRAKRENFKSNSGIVDQASYTLSVMPLTEGKFSLPALALPYFDPEQGKVETFEIPEQRFSITRSPATEESLAEVAGELESRHNTLAEEATDSGRWPIAAAIFALLWLVTLAYTVYLKRGLTSLLHRRQAPQSEQHQSASNTPLSALLAALGTPTLEAGIEKWRHLLPQQHPLINQLRQLQETLYGQTATAGTHHANELIETLTSSIKQSKSEIEEKIEEENWIEVTFENQSKKG